MATTASSGGYDSAIANLATQAKGQTYRQFLQSIINKIPQSTQAAEARAILAVTGDDGNVNPSFIGDPYAYTGSDSGQVVGGYGPEGVQRLNGIYSNAFQAANPAPDSLGGGTIDPDASARISLRDEIRGRGADVDSVYSSLFGDLDKLVSSRDSDLEKQYGDQFKGAADTYASALPEIETSYAAIGASDSTDQTDAKGKAKSGFDQTTKTIGENKAADKSKLGQYKTEQAAKFNADKASASRNVSRAGETTDVDALRNMRNDLERNIDQAGVTRATLGTNGDAAKAVSALTADAGRYDAAVNALDSIIKSSMSGSVKEAAVKAIADNSGLSAEEKEKVNQQYGNVYAEQAAL